MGVAAAGRRVGAAAAPLAGRCRRAGAAAAAARARSRAGCPHLRGLLTGCSVPLPRKQEARSQLKNRERAMALLRAKLFEMELEKQKRCAL